MSNPMPTLAPEVEARMRPLWKEFDRALRSDVGVAIEIATACNRMTPGQVEGARTRMARTR